MREPEPLAFLIASIYPWGSDEQGQPYQQQQQQHQVAGGMDEDDAMAGGPLLAPPFECGTYARGRMPSFKSVHVCCLPACFYDHAWLLFCHTCPSIPTPTCVSLTHIRIHLPRSSPPPQTNKHHRKGRSGRLYLRRFRQVTEGGILEVDRASIHLSPDEARLLSLERCVVARLVVCIGYVSPFSAVCILKLTLSATILKLTSSATTPDTGTRSCWPSRRRRRKRADAGGRRSPV